MVSSISSGEETDWSDWSFSRFDYLKCLEIVKLSFGEVYLHDGFRCFEDWEQNFRCLVILSPKQHLETRYVRFRCAVSLRPRHGCKAVASYGNQGAVQSSLMFQEF